MAGSTAPRRQTVKIDRIAMTWLYPRLRELPPEVWKSTLGKARDTDFETAEWIGVIGGVAFVAWLLGVEPSVQAMEPRFIVHFVLALPLLAAVVGPIYLRRTRRGLDRELARRAASNGTAIAPPGELEP